MREVAERESGNRLKDNRGVLGWYAAQMRGLRDAVDVGNELTAYFYQRLLTVNPLLHTLPVCPSMMQQLLSDITQTKPVAYVVQQKL